MSALGVAILITTIIALCIICCIFSQDYIDKFFTKMNPFTQGKQACDIRSSHSDACSKCQYGHKRIGLNDICCDKNDGCEKGETTPGQVCDRRLGKHPACEKCKYGSKLKAFNIDWCCQEGESGCKHIKQIKWS